MDKTIIVMEGATVQEMIRFSEALNETSSTNVILLPKGIRLFKKVKGELFEVVDSLKKVKED